MSIGHKDSDNFVRGEYDRRQPAAAAFTGVPKPNPWRLIASPSRKNTVRDNKGWGLFLDGATEGTIIRGNTIEDTGDGQQKTAIRIGKEAGSVTLENNVVRAEIELSDERPATP